MRDLSLRSVPLDDAERSARAPLWIKKAHPKESSLERISGVTINIFVLSFYYACLN
jgi:hypothetical protein